MNKFSLYTIYILLITVLLFGYKSTVFADTNCTKESAMQMSKILYKEVGGTLTQDSGEDAFAKFVTAAVILNNASKKSGSTMYEKELNLTNGNYSGYYSYRDKSFDDVVYKNYQSKLLYISECVLNGTFTLPSNMVFQASPEIVNRYGHVWTSVKVSVGAGSDVYFGYEGQSLSSTDVYGKTLSNTSPEYYRALAKSLINKDYSSITSSTVCSGAVDTSGVSVSPNDINYEEEHYVEGSDEPGGTNAPSTKIPDGKYKEKVFHTPKDFCDDENVQKAFNILMGVVNILKIVAPIIIIITSGISLFKVVTDDGDIKASVKSFITKIVIAAFIFFLPGLIMLAAKAVSAMTDSTVDIAKCFDLK